MPLTGIGPYRLGTDSSDQGTNNMKWVTVVPTSGNMGVADFSTTTTVRTIAWVPLGSNASTTGLGPRTTNSWNLANVDMDSSNPAVFRIVEAGTWTVTGGFTSSAADVGGNALCSAVISILDVSGTPTATEVARGTSEAVSLTIAGEKTFAVSLTMPQIVLNQSQTIQVSMFVNARGVAVLGQTLTLRRNNTGLTAPLEVTLPGSGLRYAYTADVAAGTGSGSVAFSRRWAALRGGSVASTVAVSVAKGLVIARERSVTGVHTLGFTRRAALLRSHTVQGNSTTLFSRRLGFPRNFSVLGNANTSMSRNVLYKRVFGVVGAASTSANRILNSFKSFSVSSLGTASMTKFMIFDRKFAVIGNYKVLLSLNLPQAALNRMASGGTTIIKKIIAVFDD